MTFACSPPPRRCSGPGPPWRPGELGVVVSRLLARPARMRRRRLVMMHTIAYARTREQGAPMRVLNVARRTTAGPRGFRARRSCPAACGDAPTHREVDLLFARLELQHLTDRNLLSAGARSCYCRRRARVADLAGRDLARGLRCAVLRGAYPQEIEGCACSPPTWAVHRNDEIARADGRHAGARVRSPRMTKSGASGVSSRRSAASALPIHLRARARGSLRTA